jgi:hypothetical protein
MKKRSYPKLLPGQRVRIYHEKMNAYVNSNYPSWSEVTNQDFKLYTQWSTVSKVLNKMGDDADKHIILQIINCKVHNHFYVVSMGSN